MYQEAICSKKEKNCTMFIYIPTIYLRIRIMVFAVFFSCAKADNNAPLGPLSLLSTYIFQQRALLTLSDFRYKNEQCFVHKKSNDKFHKPSIDGAGNSNKISPVRDCNKWVGVKILFGSRPSAKPINFYLSLSLWPLLLAHISLEYKSGNYSSQLASAIKIRMA
jgi:hypothetical protein